MDGMAIKHPAASANIWIIKAEVVVGMDRGLDNTIGISFHEWDIIMLHFGSDSFLSFSGFTAGEVKWVELS